MRAVLRDDPGARYQACGGAWAGLDDDFSVPADLDGDPGAGEGSEGDWLPTIWVRDRVDDGMDDYGNPKWKWEDRASGVPAVTWLQREERDDRAGVTLVLARVLFDYKIELPEIRETAAVKTDDGNVWKVTSVSRYPNQVELHLERVEDGP